MASIPDLLAWLFAFLLGIAAVQDIFTLRIANMVSVAVLVVAAIALALHPGPNWWQHLLSFAIVLAAGVGLFSLGWMGGGDAKLMAAAALGFDLAGLVRFVPLVLMAGGVIALASIMFGLLLPRRPGIRKRKGIPYGVAIAVGAIAALLVFRPATAFAG